VFSTLTPTSQLVGRGNGDAAGWEADGGGGMVWV